MNTVLLVLITTLAVAGSFQTIVTTLQLAQKAAGSDQVERYFKHPFVQTLLGCLGCSFALAGHLIQQVIARKRIVEDEAQKEIQVNIFIILPSAILDIVGIVFCNAGMYYI